MNDPQSKVLTTPEVAELMGWSVEYVRKGMKRNGISEVRGWPEDQVRALLDKQKQEGARTDPRFSALFAPTETEAGQAMTDTSNHSIYVHRQTAPDGSVWVRPACTACDWKGFSGCVPGTGTEFFPKDGQVDYLPSADMTDQEILDYLDGDVHLRVRRI